MNDKPNNKPSDASDDNAEANTQPSPQENNIPALDNNDGETATANKTNSPTNDEQTPPLHEQDDDKTETVIVSEPTPANETIEVVEIEEPPKPTETPPATEKKATKKGFWLLGTLIIVGWGATAAAGYWGYQQALQYQSQNVDIQSALTTLKNELDNQLARGEKAQAGQLQTFKQSVDGEFKAINREATTQRQKLQLQLKEHEARLNGQQERLTSLSTTSREDWLLAEAEYLLKLANQRVLMERTPANAVALLARADAIMERVSAGLGDRELFAIRKLLADEITALRLIEPVDTQGIYLKLGSLASAIDQLPTLPTKEERFSNSKATEPMRETTWAAFKREMDNVFSFLRNSFSMRSADELANPIVSQQRLQLMQLNTRLLLEQAQISLLKEDTVSYQESLKAASELVTQYYFESPKRAAFSEELISLAQKDIAPTLPDISHSLKLLHSYIATQHRLNAPNAGQNSDLTKGAQ